MDWLKDTIDPKLVVPALIWVGGWLFKHRKDLNFATIEKAITDAMTSKAMRMLDNQMSRDAIAATLEDTAWRAVARFGVERDKAPKYVKNLVTAGIERGLKIVDEELNKRKLAAIAAGAQSVVEAFKPKGDVPVLNAQVEEIK